MPPEVAVDVVDVSKQFRLYNAKYQSLKERLLHAGRNPHEDFWALHDVRFEVYEGETVGILGRNGSGKSTLLKCISGILQPTAGKVVVRGKVAALLELGAGFNPELSGRENIFLNASLLGLSTKEVERRFDSIVGFAELEHFIDNQVKFYSSGMYVRLGFAVAVNVEPDILVIDEVLAVGDENFQRKCMDRVKTFQDEGRTIIFVSHSPDQVRAICDRAVVLEEGRMVGFATPGEAVRLFRERMLEPLAAVGVPETPPEPGAPVAPRTAEGAVASGIVAEPTCEHFLRPVRLSDVEVIHPDHAGRPYLVSGEPMKVRVGFEASAPAAVVFTVEIRDQTGNVLVRTSTELLEKTYEVPVGAGVVEFCYSTFPFLDGAYDVAAGIRAQHGGVNYDWREQACRFEVMNPGRNTGMVLLPVQVDMQLAGHGTNGESAGHVAPTGQSLL